AFLKNIGSNFILKDKKFQFALKIGWRALAKGEPTKTFPNWRGEKDSKTAIFLRKISDFRWKRSSISNAQCPMNESLRDRPKLVIIRPQKGW
ncbi:hypothetical protein COT42_08655, partial [Candidatus Saganbacteria bacterium CG08_land_8_20_14_0_20_45_16]